MQQNDLDYKKEFFKTIQHEKGRHFLLDFGGDQAAVSIFAYTDVLKRIGVDRVPRVNSFVQLSALPEEEFLKRYSIGFRWLYPKPSKKQRELNERYKDTVILDIRSEIERGYISGGVGSHFYDEWGVRWKRSAFYFEPVEHPLAGSSFEEIKRHGFPDPGDQLRFENLKAELQTYLSDNPQYVIPLSQSYGGILETASWTRGLTDFYMDIGSNSRECRYLLDKTTDYFCELYRHYLSAIDGNVDIVAIGDDYGMQDRMLMSPEMWRKQIKPRYGKLIDSIKSRYPHLKIFHHSCGSIFPIIEDLIAIGVDILNPIQPTARDMEPERIKRLFGNRITFHGGIDIQNLLPFGSTDEVKKEVRKVLDILSEDGGYIVAPSHNIQASTPVDNILAFYDTVKEYAERHSILT